MANATFPDKTINYNVYDDGESLLGTATVELPELAYVADTLSGAGLAGEIETPVLGHMQAMQVTLNWNTIEVSTLTMLANRSRTLTLRSAQQKLDTSAGHLVSVPVKITLKTLPKSVSLGNLEMGAKTDSTSVLEVTYIKIDIDNETVLEIDKPNYICSIDGEDLLSEVRSNLGL